MTEATFPHVTFSCVSNFTNDFVSPTIIFVSILNFNLTKARFNYSPLNFDLNKQIFLNSWIHPIAESIRMFVTHEFIYLSIPLNSQNQNKQTPSLWHFLENSTAVTNPNITRPTSGLIDRRN